MGHGNFNWRNCEFETGTGKLKMEKIKQFENSRKLNKIEIEKRKMENGLRENKN